MSLEAICEVPGMPVKNNYFLPPSALPQGTVLDQNPVLKQIYIDEINTGTDKEYQPWIEGADKLLPEYLTQQFGELPVNPTYN